VNRILFGPRFSETEDRSRFRRYSRLLVYLSAVTNIRRHCRKKILSQLPESLFEPPREPSDLCRNATERAAVALLWRALAHRLQKS
jgi:hypothetical protein